MASDLPVTVYLGLGGNVGNVMASMSSALQALDSLEDTSVKQVSRVYRTPPWGDIDQAWFLNACAALSTTKSPLELLDAVKTLEKQLKREKTRRWGPRTIDMDLLLYGNQSFHHERLEIPHPRMVDRAFVMIPLADIAPERLIGGQSVTELASHLTNPEIEIAENSPNWWQAVQ
jgi:2-amino-4-hydroxy-6-hydroxymethyldihydropteridine diphosphokinase